MHRASACAAPYATVGLGFTTTPALQSMEPVLPPTKGGASSVFRSISLGKSHGLAVLGDGKVCGWGSNDYGQLVGCSAPCSASTHDNHARRSVLQGRISETEDSTTGVSSSLLEQSPKRRRVEGGVYARSDGPIQTFALELPENSYGTMTAAGEVQAVLNFDILYLYSNQLRCSSFLCASCRWAGLYCWLEHLRDTWA